MRLYPLFFFSGAAALGCQIIWTKLFALTLGHEFRSAMIVIAAFFAGMGLGAAFSRRILSFAGSRAFGFIELCIGIWAFFTPMLIPHSRGFFSAFLILLPATFGMGASLPAMAALARTTANSRVIAGSYAANTLGAMAGALLGAFALMPTFGLDASVRICAAINIIVGMLAPTLAGSAHLPDSNDRAPLSRPLALTLFLSGFLAIAWEVVGFRLLAQILENTVFTMAVLLAVYLAGQSLGAALWRKFHRLEAAWAFGALALLAAASLWLFNIARPLYAWARTQFGDSLGGVMSAEILATAAMFLLPTVAMGAAFASLVERAGESRLGPAILVNSVGAAAAAIFVPFLFPKIGAAGILIVLGFGYAALGWRRPILSAIAILALLFAPRPLRITNLPPAAKLVEYREGKMANVAVTETPDGHRTLFVNNRFQMGGTAAAIPELRHGHIPLLLHPDPRRALFLGLGTGISLSSAAAHPALFGEGVELLPEVAAVLPQFFRDTASPTNIHIADARTFIRQSPNTYDVIVGDLFHPAQDGAGFLYTREHFARVQERLAEGGLFCQWLPLHQLDLPNTHTIIRTFRSVFPNAQAFILRFNVDAPVIGLVGWKGSPPQWNENWVEARAVENLLGPELRRVALGDSLRLFGCYLGGSDDLRLLAGAGPINTDARPIVVFDAPKFSFRREAPTHARLLALLGHSQPLKIGSPEFQARLQKFIAARDVYLRALPFENAGQPERALDGYIESARLSEDFTSGYAQAITIARAKALSEPAEARRILERLAEAQPNRPVAKEMIDRLFQ